MIVHFLISHYTEWVAIPPNVVVTEEDRTAGLVKSMVNGEERMKVTKAAHIKNEKGENAHYFEVRVPEAAIAMRMASRYLVNKPMSRTQVAAELVQGQLALHIEEQHIEDVDVHDSGPDVMLMAQVLTGLSAEADRTDARHKAENSPNKALRLSDKVKEQLMASYTAARDLSQFFKATYAPAAPAKDK